LFTAFPALGPSEEDLAKETIKHLETKIEEDSKRVSVVLSGFHFLQQC
jgi:hypothetical protein